MSRIVRWLQVTVLIALLVSSFHASAAHAQGQTRFFNETGQTVSGRFLEYWNDNGGLLQQGYPISGELQEKSAIDGKTYTVQYFERAVFEKHPENTKPYDVLLSLLGTMRYNAKYPNGAPAQRANDEAGSILFFETGKRVGGSFLVYFNQYGGLPQQGLPISDEFMERSDLDGKVRVVQYFQRAVMEWNPDNKPPFNVLLAQLGTFAYKSSTQPVPGLLEPQIPAPLKQDDRQYAPMASGRYMAWTEGQISGPYNQFANVLDIRALDLATNQSIVVTNAQGNQSLAAIDGPLVVWQSSQSGCNHDCIEDGVYTTDLNTSKQTKIQIYYGDGKPHSLLYPVAAGRWVAGSASPDAIHEAIVAKNVDSGAQITAYTSPLSGNDSTISNLQGSGRWLVWSEQAYKSTEHGSATYSVVYTYDLSTGKLGKVFEASDGPNTHPPLPLYSLNGGKLVLGDQKGSLTYFDLDKNTQTKLSFASNVFGLQLFGNVLLVSTVSGNAVIYGWDLTKPEQAAVKLLEPAPGTAVGPGLPNYSATVAGDWLVWSDWTHTQTILSKKKLELAPVSDPNGGPLPTLPEPAQGRSNSVKSAYGSNILYWDCPLSSIPEGQAPCLLRVYDLQAQKDNPYVPGLTPEQAVEVVLAPGGLLVWRLASQPDCTGCTAPGIYAVDLQSGTSYEVASGVLNRYSLSAYGKTVVWIEQDGGSERIMWKNLETGETRKLREVLTGPPFLGHLQVSDVFVLWVEEDSTSQAGEKSSIVALNMNTGKLSTVFNYDYKSNLVSSFLISLDVSRVAVKYGSTFFVHNLYTGEKVFMGGQNIVTWLQLQDKKVVYTTVPYDTGVGNLPTGTAVYAIHIAEPEKVYTLIPYNPAGYESHVASLFLNTLYYSDLRAQQPRLQALKLPYELVSKDQP